MKSEDVTLLFTGQVILLLLFAIGAWCLDNRLGVVEGKLGIVPDNEVLTSLGIHLESASASHR